MVTFKPYRVETWELYALIGFIALALLFLVGFMLVTAARAARMEYRLDPDGLTIVWGEPRTIPYADIRSVERVEGRPRLRRIVGTAISGLHLGTFSLQGVGRVRLYAGRIDQHLVLVDAGPHGRLGLTPEDPDRFVAELRRRLP